MFRPHRHITFTILALAGALAATTLHGQAQSRTFRRGGPHDWSHGRLLATRFGPDLDANVDRDWRTFAKHQRLNDARATRPVLDLFNLLQQVVGPKTPQQTAGHLDWNLRTGGYGNVVGAPAKYSF